MLSPEVPDDLCARVRPVAQDAPAHSFGERGKEVLREAVRIGGHGFLGDDSGDFPMAGRRVLAPGSLPAAPVGGQRMGHWAQEVQLFDIGQTERAQIRDEKLSRGVAGG